MKAKLLFSLVAVAGFVLASANSADAGLFRKKGCCEPTCCAAEPTCCAPEPACCAPEPTCCEPAGCCDSCCGKKHRLRDFFKKLCHRNKCCQSSCCEPTCCEPACGEPTCGCAH
jgi:hypothetical protein